MLERQLIFVLGVGRSGTSVLTRTLSLCGCAIPQALAECHPKWNPGGLWEPLEALQMNETLLHRHGSNYFDTSLRVQREIAFDSAEREGYIGEILAFLDSCPQAPRLVLKEPRITALFKFWLEAARRRDFSVKVVIPIRHPREVCASFAFWNVPEDVTSVLWLKYNLLAERGSRDLPRVFVSYQNLLQDWRTQVARIAATLAIELPLQDEQVVDHLISYKLYRKREPQSPGEVFGDCLVSRAYDSLFPATQDGSVDLRAVDEIYLLYQENERALRLLCSGSLNGQPVSGGGFGLPLYLWRFPAD